MFVRWGMFEVLGTTASLPVWTRNEPYPTRQLGYVMCIWPLPTVRFVAGVLTVTLFSKV